MIKCVIQAADIHIRNFQRLNEYTEQLNKFIDKCKDIASSYERDEIRILLCGDLVHQKLNISNELMVFCSYFLRELEKIADVIVYAGNHDLLVNNTTRTDTLTALFDTANFEHCRFLDRELDYESGCIKDDNIVWALYSIYDDYDKPELLGYEDKTIIGLYHGTVVGATLNNGTVMENGVSGDIFQGCSCVMAGDIHKRQILKRGDVEIIYPGSLIQQTFGETISQHGFVKWNIETMSHEFVDLENEYSLYDISINSIDDIDNNEEKLINF
jgi:DNA repair exonuclease SbcCD nuclease subunit